MRDLDLLNMTLKDFIPKFIVTRNVYDQIYQFIMKELGYMNSEGRTNRHNGDYMLPRNISGRIKIQYGDHAITSKVIVQGMRYAKNSKCTEIYT